MGSITWQLLEESGERMFMVNAGLRGQGWQAAN